jgi:hypothetical protein
MMTFTLRTAGDHLRRRIDLGTFSAKDDLLGALCHDPLNVSNLGVLAIRRPEFVLESEQTTVELVGLTFPEMGFPDGAFYGDMMNWGAAVGLKPCRPEVGPQYRLSYQDQPIGEWHRFAMEPIMDEDDRPQIWRVGHEKEGKNREVGLWLCTAHGHAHHFWRTSLNPKYRFFWELPY